MGRMATKPRLHLVGKGDTRVAYRTKRGKLLLGRIEAALESPDLLKLRGKVNLILTSPPFPLVRKKAMEMKQVKLISLG
jgi:hypothetical protein